MEIRPLEFVGLEKLAVARLVSFRFVLTSTAFRRSPLVRTAPLSSVPVRLAWTRFAPVLVQVRTAF